MYDRESLLAEKSALESEFGSLTNKTSLPSVAELKQDVVQEFSQVASQASTEDIIDALSKLQEDKLQDIVSGLSNLINIDNGDADEEEDSEPAETI